MVVATFTLYRFNNNAGNIVGVSRDRLTYFRDSFFLQSNRLIDMFAC